MVHRGKKYRMFKKVLITVSLLVGCMGNSLVAAQESAVTDSSSVEQSDAGSETALNQAILLYVDSSKAYVNGQLTKIDMANPEITPFVDHGNTFVPLRFLSDKLGAQLSFNAKTGEITITANGRTGKTRVGDTALYINNQKIVMSTAAKVVNGTTYLPLRNVVEDLFQKKLAFNNGMIIISDGGHHITDEKLVSLEQELRPKIVYAGGFSFMYLYGDGSSHEFEVGDLPALRLWEKRSAINTDGHFYYEEYDYGTMDEDEFFRTTVQGEVEKFVIPASEKLSLEMGHEGDMYFNSVTGNIVKINDGENASSRHVIGKGNIFIEAAYIDNDIIWFTDYGDDGNYTIFKLQNGKKTKLSQADCFLKYVHNNWIYYNYFENNRWTLYRMKMDGSSKKKLTGDADVTDSRISDNKIYYMDRLAKTMREMNLDGSGKRAVGKLSESAVEIFDISGGTIYYTEDNQLKWTQSLWKMDIATGLKKRLVFTDLNFNSHWERIENVSVLGDYVYYWLEGRVYAVKKDGTGRKEIGYFSNYYGRAPVIYEDK